MSQPLIEELRLSQFSCLLSTLSGMDCKLNIVDFGSSCRIYPTTKDENESNFDLLSCFSDHSTWATLDNGVEKYTDPENILVLRILIKLGSEEKEYWLTVYFTTKATHANKENVIDKARLLKTISEIICEDYTQNTMLDGMARELAIRYEELNVIYDMEELSNVHTDNDVDEKKTLQRLIKNCLDYLPVDLAAIIIPSERLLISNITGDTSINDAEAVLNLFSSRILNIIKKSGETLVVNRDEVTDWVEVEKDMPVKFIVSPIFSVDNKTTGIFVFANEIDKVNFTNSDRKLCDVFALEVTNVLKSKRDVLTGLLNRRGFEDKLHDAIIDVQNSNVNYSLVHFDIDQFSIINDTSGYSAGDKLLQQVSTLLRTTMEELSVIARIDADSFCILLKNCSLEKTKVLSEKIQRTMKEIQFLYSDKIFDINLSIGITEITDDMKDSSSILKFAQIACAAAKEMGGGRIRVFNTSDKDLIDHQNIMTSAYLINEALRKNKFVLYGQAIVAVDPKENDTGHYEVLIRMIGENNKIVPPGMFIPAAERYKMMKKLDAWVVDNSIESLSEYNQLRGDKSLILSINISGQSIGDDRFKNYVANRILDSDVRPEQLCFEITETAAVANLSEALSFIDKMRELGCSFALDDFGSGMSSFNYLKHLPVDYLKIDGCFVKNILEQDIDAAMVEAINNIGHVMGLKTVAEFVENNMIQKSLTEMGVDYLQGYGLHKPEPLVDIFKLSASEYAVSEAVG